MIKEKAKAQKSIKSYDIESQKAIPKNDDKLMTINTLQSEEKEEKVKKKSIFEKLCSIFQSTNKYDGEWMEEDIVKLINKRSQNGRQIKKFMQNLCENQKYFYLRTQEFSEKVNQACEQYFLPQDQKDLTKSKSSASKKLKNDDEITAEEYKQMIDKKNSKLQEDQEQSKQGQSPNIKNFQKQISGASNPQFALKKSNINQSVHDPNKSVLQSQDLDNEKQTSGKKYSIQDQDDFSEQSQAIQQKSKQNSDKEDNDSQKDGHDDDGEDEDSQDENDQSSNKERKRRQNYSDDEIDNMNFSDSDNEEEEEKKNGEDGNEDEDDDDDDDDDEYLSDEIEDEEEKNEVEEKNDKKKKNDDKTNKKSQEKDNQALKKLKPKISALDSELIKGSSIDQQNIRSSKTRHFSTALSLYEPKYLEIVKDKVERIRVLDKYNKSVVSFRILDQSIDSYLPDILNRLSNQFYGSAFFQNVILNEPSEFDLEKETDEYKKALIKKLPEQTKSLSFNQRTIELIKFYEEQGEDLKQKLKLVRQDVKQEQKEQYYYEIQKKAPSAFQHQEYLNRQKAKTQQAKNIFKKIFARYLFHREEDIFYVLYHLFNKQIVYHSDCLDQLNRFDRWILVNQGDLEKLKEKKKTKLQQMLAPEKETVNDMMKTLLLEVDKYLGLVQNINMKSSKQQQPSRKGRERKEFTSKKKQKK